MHRIAKFEKVSFEQFKKDWQDTFEHASIEEIQALYEQVSIPQRATVGSAGYDFKTVIPIELAPQESAKIPTGIRASIEQGWVLQVFPRSGLGFKYRLQLNNTVGIIDSDYYCSDNEGHIFIKITNDTNENKTLSLKVQDGFAQGIFLPFGITEDDACDGVRNGGFGSTSK